MLIYLLIVCIYAADKLLLEEQFQRVVGLQQLDVRNLISSQLHSNTKLIVTLTFEDQDIPILLVCFSKPVITNPTDLEELSKQKCICDINAFEHKQLNQSISLKNAQIPIEISKMHNIYQLFDDKIFVGAFSHAQSTYKLSAQIKSSYICSKECKNGGTCFYGVCECLVGSFGDDCSIQGMNIGKQTELNSNQVYFLNLEQISGSTFLRILQNSIQLNYQCYVNQPYLNHGDQIITNLIQLDYQRIQNCKTQTAYLESEIKIKEYPYYIFSINSTFQVKIIDNDTSNGQDDNSQLVMLIIIPILILFVIAIGICCIIACCKKSEVVPDEKIPEYLDQYMSVQLYSEVAEPGQVFSSREDQYCAICLEQFSLTNKIRVTYCKHIFHSKCIIQWLKKISTCPLCRAELDEKSVQKMAPRKTLTLIDQISCNTWQQTEKFKKSTLNSLTNLNGGGNQQNLLNYQRSLVMIDQS